MSIHIQFEKYSNIQFVLQNDTWAEWKFPRLIFVLSMAGFGWRLLNKKLSLNLIFVLNELIICFVIGHRNVALYSKILSGGSLKVF